VQKRTADFNVVAAMMLVIVPEIVKKNIGGITK
jgi:hypothetical protein